MREVLDAADAAAGAAGQRPPPRQNRVQSLAGERNVYARGVLVQPHFDAADVVAIGDDALGQREAVGEIFEVGRVAIITANGWPP